MPHKKGPKDKEFQWTRAADQDEKALPQHLQDDFKELKKEMCAGEYAAGRDLKQRKGAKKNKPKLWQARLSRSYRVTFTFEKKKGLATFQRMGPHSDFD